MFDLDSAEEEIEAVYSENILESKPAIQFHGGDGSSFALIFVHESS
jgi:hypothetical protein